jgi:hypothetical protein
MKPLIFVALVCLAQGAVFAQDAPKQSQPQRDAAAQARVAALYARILDFQKRHTITVNGSENPAGLRRAAVFATLFPQYGPADDAAFAQYALERYGATGSDTEVLTEARRVSEATAAKPSVDICARVLDGSLSDGPSIARYITQAEEESDRDAVARYQSILDKLSPRVRANVLQKIAEDVVGMSSSDLDHLGMAREDPDLYRTMMTGLCRGKRERDARDDQRR